MHSNNRILLAIVGSFAVGVLITLLFQGGNHAPDGEDAKAQVLLGSGNSQVEDLPGSRREPFLGASGPDLREVADVSEESNVARFPHAPFAVAFDGSEVSVDGVPLEQLEIEAWDAEQLAHLRDQLRPLQLEVFNDLRTSGSLDAFFVTSQEYIDLRRWHEDQVFFATTRATGDPDEPLEYGYAEIPRGLSPEAYVLMDAVVRSYRAPASAAELMEKGSAYEQEVRARHPDATLDLTDDLTKWTFFAPDGRIVGQISHTRNANN